MYWPVFIIETRMRGAPFWFPLKGHCFWTEEKAESAVEGMRMEDWAKVYSIRVREYGPKA